MYNQWKFYLAKILVQCIDQLLFLIIRTWTITVFFIFNSSRRIMRKLVWMRQRLSHQFIKMVRPVGVMDLLEEEISNILDLPQATLTTRGHHQTIQDLPQAIRTTLDPRPVTLLTIPGLLRANNGPDQPVAPQAGHIPPEDTMALQVATILLR